MGNIEIKKLLQREGLSSENFKELIHYLTEFVPAIKQVEIEERSEGDYMAHCLFKENNAIEIRHASKKVISTGASSWIDFEEENSDVTTIWMHVARFEINDHALDIFNTNYLRNAYTKLHRWWETQRTNDSYICNHEGTDIYLDIDIVEDKPSLKRIIEIVEQFIEADKILVPKLKKYLQEGE